MTKNDAILAVGCGLFVVFAIFLNLFVRERVIYYLTSLDQRISDLEVEITDQKQYIDKLLNNRTKLHSDDNITNPRPESFGWTP